MDLETQGKKDLFGDVNNEINEKIKQFEIMKKEQLHQKLKEKMHNLLFNE